MLWRNKNLPRRCILCDWGIKGGLTDTYRISYTFNGKVSTFPLSAESAEKADEEFKHLYPRIKTVFKIERVYTYKTVQEELQFTLTDDVKKFLLALLNSEKTHFYLEGNNAVSKEIEDKYCELTKEVLVPKRGLYNIAPDAKWGVEANIFFDSSTVFPEDFGVEPEKPGQVNSTKLFWAMIRMGFRLSGQHKKEDILGVLA